MPLGIKEFRKRLSMNELTNVSISLLREFVTLDLMNPRDLVNFFPLPQKFTKSSFTCTTISMQFF